MPIPKDNSDMLHPESVEIAEQFHEMMKNIHVSKSYGVTGEALWKSLYLAGAIPSIVRFVDSVAESRADKTMEYIEKAYF